MANGEAELPLYEVTGQTETIDLVPSGSYLNGVRITFRTRSGAQGSVFFPWSDYTPERVTAALTARARDMEAVHASTGGA